MIIHWAKDHLKVVPKSDGMGSVILYPGYTDIEDTNWVKARDRILDRITAGDITEEWAKISPEQKADFAITKEEGKQYFAPAKLADINRPRVKSVIEDTYHIATLDKWLENETRQDVRLSIMKQLAIFDKNNAEEHKMAYASAMDKV